MFLFFHNSTCAMCTFISSTNNFAHAQTLSRMNSLSGRMNIARVNIECFTGCKRIKQRRISFVLGYLRIILWKISTAISIKHRILSTFNIKKNSILTACMPLTHQSYITSGAETAYPCGAPEFTLGVSGVRVTRCVCFVDCYMSFCPLFFCPLCCLSFFAFQILITPLVSSNSSYTCTCIRSTLILYSL
jgi:hypothetical protein